ncbi:hypothetical protein [Specibacter cremeus]|uniref:hypothetical protein n=1 Tax=Specibacter cremeus TaxID=1629051 RepID=UPI001F0BB485|nr:hypothetical protein [Specibacter cremeus]
MERKLFAPAGAAAALAAVVLLAGCSGGGAPAPSTGGTTAATATASTSASAPGSATGTATTTSSSMATSSATSTVNALVQGFPSKLLPLMPGATVTASSFDRSTTPATASLTATTAAKQADILAYYTKAFTAQGFTAQPGDTVAGVPTKTFTRATGQDVITLSLDVTSSRVTFTLGANVLPASLK